MDDYNRKRTPARAVACALALALGAFHNLASADIGQLVTDIEPIAFGIPTVEIFVSGPFGGDIEWNNTGAAQPFPEGACGFRVKGNNMLEWAWYEGGVAGNDYMDHLPNAGYEFPHVPNEWIEFTGPYGANCEDGYVFVTPSTPTGTPPIGAVKLVIQFLDWDDIEFLDSGFQPYEVPEGWDPDPEPIDPCEAIPEFCESPADDFAFDFGCNWAWMQGLPCDEEEEDAELGALGGFNGAWNVRVVVGALDLPSRAIDPNVLLPIDTAREWLDMTSNALLKLRSSADARELSRAEARYMGFLSTAVHLSHGKLEQCQEATEEALYAEDARSRQQASEACEQAAMQMIDIHEAGTAYARLRQDERKLPRR